MPARRKCVAALFLTAASIALLIFSGASSDKAELVQAADDIIVSQESSFCEGDLTLELSTEGGYAIYYTLDGSVPDLESMCYESPITFACTNELQSCVIRACAWNEAIGEWGDLFTRTYFYASDMQTILNRFSTYIVCLTSDPYNLTDYEYGIMVEGKIRDDYINSDSYQADDQIQPANYTQKGRDWERDVYVEILSPEGKLLVAQDAGIRIFGNATRQYYHKSFKLYAREEYGESEFSYPLFSDNFSGVNGELQKSYERLVLRAQGLDKSETLFREELFQRLCSEIEGTDTKSVAAASVWLNGAYYNFDWLQEVFDDVYMEENYGLLQTSDYYGIVTLRGERPTLLTEDDASDETSGDAQEADSEDIKAAEDFAKLKDYAQVDLTDDAVFAEFCKLIDIENMIQYFAIETYIANWDWPGNNIKMYRYYSSNGVYGDGRQDGRWRYLYYDMEAGFNIWNEPEENWLSIETVMGDSVLFSAVMERQDMQELFAYYIDLCINEYFTIERVQDAIEQLKSERDGELYYNLVYKQSVDETYTLSVEDVEAKIEVIYDFVEKRPASMREEIYRLFGLEI